ncbi:MAG: sigma-54 dependent transcriptional regulator [Deltaproteobacteria bacterium]|nr:sigma-54 dependent transcriptional regulator [Deltaproteobacteria bacterium]
MGQEKTSIGKKISLKGISVLLLDRDSLFLRSTKHDMEERGAKILLSSDIFSAKLILSQQVVHAVFANFDILSLDQFEFCSEYKAINPDGRVFAVHQDEVKFESEYRHFDIDGGFLKPLDYEKVARKLKKEVHLFISSISTLDPLTEILRPFLIFRSTLMRQRLALLPNIASSSHSVLITGETGTGKEMVARAIHSLSSQVNGPFIALNCGAIPENLIEGELFGHEKGSFTGAQSLHRGKFELAKDGTLFLDEIGEMPLVLQARLLRVLEERQFYRVGGEKPISVNLRIVAATQVHLEKAVENGLFREDLYYRLNVLRIHLPALRERTEDIALLAWHFIERAFLEMNRSGPYPTLPNETIALLKKQPWRGNVRELRNLMTRLAVLLPPGERMVKPDYIAAYFPERVFNKDWEGETNDKQDYLQKRFDDSSVIEVSPSNTSDESIVIPLGSSMKEAEEIILKKTLDFAGGNRTQTAKILGVGLRTIRRKLNE